jgi:ribosome-associated translation inhibitor RaiA
MFKDNLFLKFQGFHPSEFTRSYLYDRMTAIQEESPYGANIHAQFTRREHSFKGVVTVYSAAGKFCAVATSSKLKEVVEKLFDQIRKQLQRWKSKRVLHHSLRDLSVESSSPPASEYTETA